MDALSQVTDTSYAVTQPAPLPPPIDSRRAVVEMVRPVVFGSREGVLVGAVPASQIHVLAPVAASKFGSIVPGQQSRDGG
ncbi:MAG: hypothetical protein HQL37_12905, partial [Alphaproteobacteria bacterium]|nr:hypothetical protein [Alphaproteobacteria bacterium]